MKSDSSISTCSACVGLRRLGSLASEARGYLVPPKDTFNEDWSTWRKRAWQLVNTDMFNTVVGVIIISNIVHMSLEVQDVAQRRVGRTETIPIHIHRSLDQTFLLLYTFEIFLRLLVSRCSFFSRTFQVFDFTIVLFAWIEFVVGMDGVRLPSASILRVLRVLRLARAVRIMVKFPELHNMVKGFASAVAAMFWGFVMILLLLVVFAIMTVEILSGKSELFGFDDGSWCHDAFHSVWLITLMFFQNLVAGDSWGECALPVIRKIPLTFFIFSIALVCVQLGFTNLILSTIVETASSNRQEDAKEQAMRKRKQGLEALDRLSEIGTNLDADRGGEISLEEFLAGYDTQVAIRDLLQKLDLERKDILQLFCLMDVDSSGTISQEEFIDCLRKAESQDMRVQMLALKFQVSDIARNIEGHMSKLVNTILKQKHSTLRKRRATPRHGSITKDNRTCAKKRIASAKLSKMQSVDDEISQQSCDGAFIGGRGGGGDLDRSIPLDAGLRPEPIASTSSADSFIASEPSVLDAKHMRVDNMPTASSLWSMKFSSPEKGILSLNGETAEPGSYIKGDSLLRRTSAVDHFHEVGPQKILDAWLTQPPNPTRMEMHIEGCCGGLHATKAT
eukprot:TRINITY_DN17352_c0_g1_i3.p1 TRINITY_DN17352_c0_g1~~TRINITY_DN17352_c0_g1_i3.p1  ORF type:complete len:619 (+),score=81.31 TRINITY_DN17352_c0_g1_i3:100-1956(+)